MSMQPQFDPAAEWLETDGLGGFASGTVAGPRTRRYHALSLAGDRGPSGRRVLVNGLDAFLATGETMTLHALSVQHYRPDVLAPRGDANLAAFSSEPWPRWEFALPNGVRVAQEIFVPHGAAATVVRWRRVAGTGALRLHVRPFLSGRDYHALHHENGAFRFAAESVGERLTFRPYDGGPAIHWLTNATFQADPQWYRNFLYAEESARGLDDTEDLAAPGTLSWDLADGDAVLIFARDSALAPLGDAAAPVRVAAEKLARRERARRGRFPTPLHRAADAYLVRRGEEQTIVAGYPWFTDWGRDTFIALRGLCLATGRLDDARGILVAWAGTISEGMLPNLIPDYGDRPEYNSVDASLWYVIAVHEFLAAAEHTGFPVDVRERDFLRHAIETILHGYRSGTRHGIRADADGLLACGEPGVQLTWMDAKIGDWVVTPRIGKPVEVQALWINSLWIAAEFAPERWRLPLLAAQASFESRFWNHETGCLFDVVDADHRAGVNDGSIRPNQVFALGGLPVPLLEGERARRVLATVESHLLTPLGLRSLSPADPAYRGRYEGGVRERDSAYHQGTVWPWLTTAFVEAWLRVHGDSAANRAEARERFLAPLLAHRPAAGIGHVSEIADADDPHTPRGCPWQAWSVGELLRLQHVVLAEPAISPRAHAVPLPEAGPAVVLSL